MESVSCKDSLETIFLKGIRTPSTMGAHALRSWLCTIWTTFQATKNDTPHRLYDFGPAQNVRVLNLSFKNAMRGSMFCFRTPCAACAVNIKAILEAWKKHTPHALPDFDPPQNVWVLNFSFKNAMRGTMFFFWPCAACARLNPATNWLSIL